MGKGKKDKAPENSASPEKPSRKALLLRQAREMSVLVLIILTIKGCIIDQYSIPSGSMEPTLMGDPNMFKGDRVLTNKWLFGPRVPFTTIRLWNWYEPERWDIVVFKPPEGGSKHPRLIKRVVGLPGERIDIKGQHLYINGEKVPFGPTLPEYEKSGLLEAMSASAKNSQSENPQPSAFHGYWGYDDIRREAEGAPHPEQRQYFSQMLSQIPPEYGCVPGDEFHIVPEDHYLMLGDNSANSVDGRMFGWVPRDHLYGRASAVFWPIGHRRDFTGFTYIWWGKLLVYGIPLAIVFFEIRHWRKERKAKLEPKG
jgi:signal peptidase I